MNQSVGCEFFTYISWLHIKEPGKYISVPSVYLSCPETSLQKPVEVLHTHQHVQISQQAFVLQEQGNTKYTVFLVVSATAFNSLKMITHLKVEDVEAGRDLGV